MDSIVAISYKIDDSHVAWIYPSGTSGFENLESESIGQLSLYCSKEQQKKVFFEYKESELNIRNLHLKETIRYCCLITNCETEYFPVIRNSENNFVKLEEEKDRIIFQFINYLGKTSIFFGNYGSIDFEVVADKITYEEDYINLTNAIAQECAALLLDYTSPTSLTFDHDKEKQTTTALEQFIFLRQFCYSDNLESLFASIKRNPDRLLIKEDELKPFGNGIISQKFFTNPFSNARGWAHLDNGVYLPSEISVTHKYDSLDTPANRFIKFALNTFLEICENIIKQVEESQTVYYSEALAIKKYIEEVLQDSFFDDVQDLTAMPVNNQVLEKREGYAQIFNAFSMVDLALQLDWKGRDDVYSGEAKNTALLYEYWLFFELRKIISQIDNCEPIRTGNAENSFIKESDGLTISLKQDNESIQEFETDNQKINLYYNRTFNAKEFKNSKYIGSYSKPFRPDYTIAIFPKKIKTEKIAIMEGAVRYIHFDAKYRLEDLSQFINKTEDSSEENSENEIKEEKIDSITNTYKRGDLLKMHTYNDAIRRTIGSYVLYPGTDNKEGKLFSAYDEILPGVGAFAIKPSRSEIEKLNEGEIAVQTFIKQCIEFNSNPAGRIARTGYFENMVLETPSINSGQSSPDNDLDLTMIGFVKEDYNEFLKKYNYKTEGDYFFFYFRAIEKGKVYTLHKETFQAKYLRFTTKKFVEEKIDKRIYKYEKLEPWKAEIDFIKLVSQDVLKGVLKEYQTQTNHIFNAEYYYLVKAKITNFSDEGITAISTEENNIISPYSPKIVQLFEGDKIHS